MTLRVRDHVQVAAAAALAMLSTVVATSMCASCSLWNVGWRAVVSAIGAAAAGALVSVGHRRVKRFGYVGEALLGAAAVWTAFAAILYFTPFVWDSYFRGRAPYLSATLLVPSVLLGALISLDLRLRDRRHRDRRGDSDTPVPWQHRYSFLRQVVVATTALVLGTVGLDVYETVRWSLPVEERTEMWRAHAEDNPDDLTAWIGYSQTLLEAQAWKDALRAAERAKAIDSTAASAHEALAWAQLGLGQDSVALRHFSAAAGLDPENGRLWRDLARMAHMIGAKEQAREAYQHLEVIAPDRLFWAEEDRNRWAELFGGPE